VNDRLAAERVARFCWHALAGMRSMLPPALLTRSLRMEFIGGADDPRKTSAIHRRSTATCGEGCSASYQWLKLTELRRGWGGKLLIKMLE
jgi:hypothetical protein